MRQRVTILGLMGVVVPIALGVAALKNPCALWASTLFTLLVIALLVTTLGSFQARSAALRGFSLFGWAYLVVAFATTPPPVPITTFLVNDAYYDLNGLRHEPGTSIPVPPRVGLFPIRHLDYHTRPTLEAYRQVAHLLIGTVAASAGALLATITAARSGRVAGERPPAPRGDAP